MIAGILWKNPPQKCVFCIFYQSFKLLSDDCINSISNNFLFDDFQFYRCSNIDCNECDISNIFRWWWCDSPHYLNPGWLMIWGGGEGRPFSSLCIAVLRAESEAPPLVHPPWNISWWRKYCQKTAHFRLPRDTEWTSGLVPAGGERAEIERERIWLWTTQDNSLWFHFTFHPLRFHLFYINSRLFCCYNKFRKA